MSFKETVLITRGEFINTPINIFNMVERKLNRSLEAYDKNVRKNVNYLMYCRNPDKVKKYLDRKYKVEVKNI